MKEYKINFRHLCMFLASAVLLQVLLQIYLSPKHLPCGDIVPPSHLSHPLLKMASQVKATSQIVTLIFEDMESIEFLQNSIMEVQKAGIKDYIIIAGNQTSCEILLEKCYFANSSQLFQDMFNNTFNLNNNNTTINPSIPLLPNEEAQKAIAKAQVWLELLQNNYSIFSIATNVFLRDNPLLVWFLFHFNSIHSFRSFHLICFWFRFLNIFFKIVF